MTSDERLDQLLEESSNPFQLIQDVLWDIERRLAAGRAEEVDPFRAIEVHRGEPKSLEELVDEIRQIVVSELRSRTSRRY